MESKKDTKTTVDPLLTPLPSYIPREDFLRLSSYAQEKVLSLLSCPPDIPKGYLKRKDQFTARGYQSYVHFEISRILEHLEYASD